MIQFESVMDVILFIIEVIGCVSFASSGAITAIRKRADILGIWILTLIEIFGGGLLRDLIIGEIPHILWDPEFLILAAISLVIATGWFFVAYFPKTAGFIDKHRNDHWIYILDAIGISVFCIAGVKSAEAHLPENANIIGIYVYDIVLGVITGTGGGMFRDVFIGEIPGVFKKHFYMTPCILACLVYTLMYRTGCNAILSAVIGILIIVVLRTLATIFHWNLPFARGYNKLKDEENATMTK